jgi:hypothetical protein
MIYFDYNATTPVLPEVVQAMMSYLASEWGNLSARIPFLYRCEIDSETHSAPVSMDHFIYHFILENKIADEYPT